MTPSTSRWRAFLAGVTSLAVVGLGAPVAPADPASATALPAAETAPTELFISEYIEGSSNNKALELYNPTGQTVDLTGYSVQMFFNGSATAGLTVNLTGSLAPGDVFVLAQSSASPTVLAQADQTSGSGWFNGDDAVTLRNGTTVIDSLGQAGVDPGSEWGSGLTSTADNTLRRMASARTGDPTLTDAFDPATQWQGYATDTFDGLGSHTADCGGPERETAVINEFSANIVGTDVEYIEVYGDPNTDFADLTVLQVEGDSNSAALGTVVTSHQVGTTDADGFWLVDTGGRLQNGTLTLLLVSG